MTMSTEPQPGERKWRRRIAPSILGFACSFSLLFLGVSIGPGWTVLFIPGIVILLLAALALAKRSFPRLAAWCEFGITFLLATVTGTVLIGSVVAALVWASFDTEYAAGYTEKAFRAVRPGDTQEAVLSRLGDPISSHDTEPFRQWIFSANEQLSFAESGVGNGTYTIFTFDVSGRVKNVSGQTQPTANTIRMGDGENFLKLKGEEIKKLHGATLDEIGTRFGQPVAVYDYRASKVLDYSRSPSSSHYNLRRVGMNEDGKVVHICSSGYWD
jgi:hypothetical protein